MANNFEIQKNIESELVFGERENDKIDLSIVIPTYKRIDLLKKTIVSILNQKKDCGLEIEVIVVSNDTEFNVNSLDLMLPSKKFYIYRNKENLGMVGNMNRCAVLSRGTYVSYIQDDDVLLPNYISEVYTIIKNSNHQLVDCLIPNRYMYYGNNTIQKKQEKRKEQIIRGLGGYTHIPLLQKVDVFDCGATWNNCFGGGPTCGILFNREKLLNSGGFSFEYPFAFDYIFFLEFSKKNNVYLYNKYLSIYRTTDSASNKPEVQVDFYNSEQFLFQILKKSNKFVNRYRNEIKAFSILSKSKEAQELLISKFGYPQYSKYKYYVFKARRIFNLCRRKLYRFQICKHEFESFM